MNASYTLGVTRKRRESPNDAFLKNFASFIELKKAKIEKEEEKDDQIKKDISSLSKQVGEMASVISSLVDTVKALSEKINKKDN